MKRANMYLGLKKEPPLWAKALLLGLLPLVVCFLTCLVQGKMLWQVYLPNSEWNDELYYFKQVEGIVSYGFPQGFFGFNESRALVFSFAAWSPVLVWPWVLWGLVFGWNLASPILCNLVLMMLTMAVYTLLVQPKMKNCLVLALLYIFFTPFSRYILSGMPEIICFCMLILFYAVALSYLRHARGQKLAFLFFWASLLTLMRPYMLLFLLLPCFFLVLKYKWKGALFSGLIMGVVLALYAAIKHFFGAEYFTPLFYTDWITAFFTRGIGYGIYNFFGTLYWKGKDFLAYSFEGLRSGLAAGAFFVGFLSVMLVLALQTGKDLFAAFKAKKEARADAALLTKNEWQKASAAASGQQASFGTGLLFLEGHLFLSCFGMLLALLLMYKLTEGSKHLLTFIAVSLFLIALMETKRLLKPLCLCLVFFYLYTIMALEPYDYQIPFTSQEKEIQITAWQEAFADNLSLELAQTPSYENVVIWVLSDTIVTEEGSSSKSMAWQVLYALPAGFGISCCESSYVAENIDALSCGYLTTVTGGNIDLLCQEKGFVLLYADAEVSLYKCGGQ